MSKVMKGFSSEMAKIADARTRALEALVGAGVGGGIGFAATRMSRKGRPAGEEEVAGTAAGALLGAGAGLGIGKLLQHGEIQKGLKGAMEDRKIKTISERLADSSHVSRPRVLRAKANALSAADAPFPRNELRGQLIERLKGMIGGYERRLKAPPRRIKGQLKREVGGLIKRYETELKTPRPITTQLRERTGEIIGHYEKVLAGLQKDEIKLRRGVKNPIQQLQRAKRARKVKLDIEGVRLKLTRAKALQRKLQTHGATRAAEIQSKLTRARGLMKRVEAHGTTQRGIIQNKLSRAQQLLKKWEQSEGGRRTQSEKWLREEKTRLNNQAEKIEMKIEAEKADHERLIEEAKESVPEAVRNRLFGII